MWQSSSFSTDTEASSSKRGMMVGDKVSFVSGSVSICSVSVFECYRLT